MEGNHGEHSTRSKGDADPTGAEGMHEQGEGAGSTHQCSWRISVSNLDTDMERWWIAADDDSGHFVRLFDG